jgi:hypothetical protein
MKFNFGRKYNIEWKPVGSTYLNDWVSKRELYKESIQNQRREVRFHDDLFKNRIILRRSDLSRGSLNEHRETVGIGDISSMSLSREKMARAEIIIFLDDDGQTKVLKNRYGIQ